MEQRAAVNPYECMYMYDLVYTRVVHSDTHLFSDVKLFATTYPKQFLKYLRFTSP